MNPQQDSEGKIRRAAQLLSRSSRAVAFTGAGISTPSGIPDFRTRGSGLWSRSDPMQVASLTAFRQHPQDFYDWLKPLVSKMDAALPNPAHSALARLEELHHLKGVITQNIDGLHQKAGSHNVIELHGSMLTLTCLSCGRKADSAPYRQALMDRGEMPHCPDCNRILKPDIVLYEEMLPETAWALAETACTTADVILVAGTSLEVTPAAWLPRYGLENGAKLIIVNRDRTPLDAEAEVLLHQDVAAALPQIVRLVEENISGG